MVTSDNHSLWPQIREVLLPYARAHLTVDHVLYTQRAVEELLLQVLVCVPMIDATSFLLPTDPFDALTCYLNSSKPRPFEEQLFADRDAVDFIKNTFLPPPPLWKLITERCWHTKDCEYKSLSEIHRPMSPILTQYAMRETPRIGDKKALATISQTMLSLQPFLKLVRDEVVADPPLPESHEILDLRCQVETSSNELRSFLQSVFESATSDECMGNFTNIPKAASFLKSESPARRPSRVESPPLFVFTDRRIRGNRYTNGDQGSLCVKTAADVVPLLKRVSAEVMEEEGNLNEQSMEVVDGWTTYKISSPPSYHRRSSSCSDVDELWEISRPGTPATSLAVARMEEIEIPRTRKFGHGIVNREDASAHGTANVLMTVGSPASFITSFISTAPVPMAPSESVMEFSHLRSDAFNPLDMLPHNVCSPCASESRHRKPPSPISVQQTGAKSDLEIDLHTIFTEVNSPRQQDPLSLILEERLDVKEVMLMDVPSLPPPTAHPKEPALSVNRMSNLVISRERNPLNADATHRRKDAGTFAFLSPVKGIKPLALSLSWIPFKFGCSIPTNEEVASVDRPIHVEEDVTGYIDATMEFDIRRLCAYSTLISADGQEDCDDMCVPPSFQDSDASHTQGRRENNEEFEYILTGWEKRKQNLKPPDDKDDDEHENNLSSRNPGYRDNVEDGSPRCLNGDMYTPTVHSDQLTDVCDLQPSSTSPSGIIDPDLQESPIDGCVYGFGYGDYLSKVGILNTDSKDINTSYCTERDQYNDPANLGVDECASTSRSDVLFDLGVYASPQRPFPSSERTLHSTRSIVGNQVQSTLNIALPVEGESVGSPIAWSLQGGSDLYAKKRKLDDIDVASAKDLFDKFLTLRNKALSSLSLPESSSERLPTQPTHVAREPSTGLSLDEFVDQYTVLLPDQWINPGTHHRYLASIALIQKRGFVRELKSDVCGVILVERYSLGGVDIVIDSDHAVLIAPLLGLQAQIEALSERISAGSWHYLQLLVIFEAYPSMWSSRLSNNQNTTVAPYAYTRPNLRAIQRLRRILSIADGCGSKDFRCSIIWAFANEVRDVAKFVRCFGDEAETKAIKRGHEELWGDRLWLEEEEREDEAELARVVGMNPFAAFVMLYQANLDDILVMSAERRLEEFGRLLGVERVEALNRTIGSCIRGVSSDSEP